MSNPIVPILPLLEGLEPAINNKQVQNSSGNSEFSSFDKVLKKEGSQSSDDSLKALELDTDKLHIGSMTYDDFIKTLPGFLDKDIRNSSLGEGISKIPGTLKTDAANLLSKLELEWFRLEDAMKVNNKPSFKELIGLQAQLYKVSEQLGVITKVVDEINTGVKTVLNTNI